MNLKMEHRKKQAQSVADLALCIRFSSKQSLTFIPECMSVADTNAASIFPNLYERKAAGRWNYCQ